MKSIFNKKKDMIDKEKMLRKFNIISKALAKKNIKFNLYLFGSGLGMYHLNKDYRVSNDTDFQTDTILLDDEIKKIMDDISLHEIGGIMDIPPLEELEIVEKLDYGNLTVYIPSIENFALSKLLSNRRKDYDDLANYPILDNCNIKKLQGMLDEYLPYFPFNDNPSYNFNFFDDLLEERKLN